MSICARVEPPRGGGALGKRKERERPSSSASEQPRAPPLFSASLVAKPQPPRPAHPNRFVKPMPPPPPPPFAKGGGISGFKLMAGYLAHEFLRSGTLFGERPESTSGKAPAAAIAGPAPDPRARYAEASLLLMAGGARVPGVVNPTQLGHWLRIKE